MARPRTIRRRGYTLIEVLIALIMFTFISLATGFAMTAALRMQDAVQQHTDEAQEVRHLFDVLRRDISAAYASAGNKQTFFVASGDSNQGSPLTFTSMSHRIQTGLPSNALATGDTTTQAPVVGPQSALEIVSYSWDPDSGEFRRSGTAVPNTDLIPQATTPDTLVATHVSNVQFQYLDPNASDQSTAQRDYWNYYSDPTMVGQTANSGQTDTTLPQAVMVTITYSGKDRIPHNYSTTITLATPTPQPSGQTPDAITTTPTTGGGGGGNPQMPGGGGGGGSGGPGGGGNGGPPRIRSRFRSILPGLNGIGGRP